MSEAKSKAGTAQMKQFLLFLHFYLAVSKKLRNFADGNEKTSFSGN